MKIFAVLPLFASLTAVAAEPDMFQPSSALPQALRAKVIAAVQENCLAQIYGWREEQTTVRQETIDQGQRNTYFRTFLTAKYLFDGTHPVGADFVVESAEYDITNPGVERTEVLSVKSATPGLCR